MKKKTSLNPNHNMSSASSQRPTSNQHPAPRQRRTLPIWLGTLVIFLMVTADRIAKIETNLGFRANFGFVRWTWLHNYGAAGGMLHGDRAFLITIGLGVAVLFFAMPWLISIRSYAFWIGWGFATGGTLGNLWDRVVYGYVTDMFQFSHQHGVFNLSDLGINIGFLLMLLFWIVDEIRKPGKNRVRQDGDVVELTEDSANE